MAPSSALRFWRANKTQASSHAPTDTTTTTSSDSDQLPRDSSKAKLAHDSDVPLRDRQTTSSFSDADALSPVGTAQSQQPAMGRDGGGGGGGGDEGSACENGASYRTYKRRWFGLFQMTLMNIVVSWGWLTYAPVASHAATYYAVRESSINWLSTAFFLSFVVVSPLVLLALHRPNGLRIAFSAAALLVLVGNWIRYAGATSKSARGGSTEASGRNGYALAMVGEVLIGFAQPFVLAAPTRYSDLWFTAKGRVAATAAMSLANPLGAALGQLINPFWVSKSGDVSDMVLYVSIISTVASVPSFFIPARPPTPVGPSSTTPKLRLSASLPALRSLELWLILLPFWVYVGFFNSLSSLLNQILGPYGFSDDEAGIGGAVLIVVGLVTAAVTSPLIDRTKKFLLAIKIFVPVIAGCYLVFLWMPQTRDLPGPYVILALLGASSFALVPVALECLIELSHPLNPAVTSTFAWAGGQLLGAVFVLVSDALVDPEDASPPKNMHRALIFQAVIAVAVAPLPMMLGLFGRKGNVALRRVRSDEEGTMRHVENA